MIVNEYINETNIFTPLFIQGDSLDVLKTLKDESVDCVVTSPPYYMKREYLNGGIGLENTYQEYIENILKITKEIYRVLKPAGSFWLNIGDSYKDKQLLNIPYRIAINEEGKVKKNEAEKKYLKIYLMEECLNLF